MNCKKILVSILLVLIIFTACQKTPSTTIINNEELEITTEATAEVIDVDKLPVININTEEVDEVLECGDISVTLKGTISKPDSYENIHLYSVNLMNYNEYESNMLFLFGEYENQVVRPYIFLKVSAEDGYYAELMNSSLIDASKSTSPWGAIEFFKGAEPVTEDMRKVNMTDEEARKQADEIMSRIGTTAFVYDGSKYHEEVLQITPDGTLSSPLGDSLCVYYVQEIQGIPMRSTQIESRKRPRAYVTFDSSGVSYVSISEYEYEVYSKLEKCISYEEALQIFKGHISKDKLNDGNIYTSVEFQYTIDRVYINGDFLELAIPCWYFNKEDHPDSSWDSTGDVCINCMDGSVFSADYTRDN